MNNLVHKHSQKINKGKTFVDRKKREQRGYCKHKQQL